jgi:hypothetical protein
MRTSFFLIILLLFFSISSTAQTDSSISKKNVSSLVKFNFFSPIFGHSMFSYEKFSKPHRSNEFSLSLIGAGDNVNKRVSYWGDLIEDGKRQLGVALGYGYRFYLPRRKYKLKNLNSPPLTGLYVKPSIYGTFFYDDGKINNDLVLDQNRVLSLAILLENGWQVILSDIISLELYGGFGYSFINIDFPSFEGRNNLTDAFGKNINHNQFVYTRLGRNPGIAFSGGFKFGVSLSKR